MIAKEKIEALIREKLDENLFLVDVNVSTSNVIHIEIDSFTGLTIDQCIAVSRHVEHNLDRDSEDFELQVSSPGIDQYFKVNEQYRKNVGREIEVFTTENEEIKGKLIEAGDSVIVLEVKAKEKSEIGKKMEWVTRNFPLQYEQIRKAKVIILFK